MSGVTTSFAPTERFWNKVDIDLSGCWLWRGHITEAGYGHFWDGSRLPSGNPRMVRAHRWAYAHLRGPIPEGLTIDHLCRVRNCVNPDHLEPVDAETNKSRAPITGGHANGLRQRAKTHCPHGHPYSGDNLYVSPRGHRQCRTCNRERA